MIIAIQIPGGRYGLSFFIEKFFGFFNRKKINAKHQIKNMMIRDDVC
jgi:hypothetical protein